MKRRFDESGRRNWIGKSDCKREARGIRKDEKRLGKEESALNGE